MPHVCRIHGAPSIWSMPTQLRFARNELGPLANDAAVNQALGELERVCAVWLAKARMLRHAFWIGPAIIIVILLVEVVDTLGFYSSSSTEDDGTDDGADAFGLGDTFLMFLPFLFIISIAWGLRLVARELNRHQSARDNALTAKAGEISARPEFAGRGVRFENSRAHYAVRSLNICVMRLHVTFPAIVVEQLPAGGAAAGAAPAAMAPNAAYPAFHPTSGAGGGHIPMATAVASPGGYTGGYPVVGAPAPAHPAAAPAYPAYSAATATPATGNNDPPTSAPPAPAVTHAHPAAGGDPVVAYRPQGVVDGKVVNNQVVL